MAQDPALSELVLFVGSGGVGKTSCSASLALALAEKGKRVAVITIDPAKRLAQALGLEKLSNEAQRVDTHENGGLLDALWLDTSTAFDQLIQRKVSEDLAKRITGNRLYSIIKEQLGGIEEYLAVDKLLQLGSSNDYDVCVLDTPPSQHALDFIESPEHLLKFFDESILKVFLSDSSEEDGFFKRIMSGTKQQTLQIFKRFLGQNFMSELTDLLTQSRPIHQSLLSTAEQMRSWVSSEKLTKTVIVSTPEQYPHEEAILLSKHLKAQGMRHPSLHILNRCLPIDAPSSPEEINKELGEELAKLMLKKHAMQSHILCELKGDSSGEPPKTRADSVAVLPRYSHKEIGKSALLETGREILRQWNA